MHLTIKKVSGHSNKQVFINAIAKLEHFRNILELATTKYAVIMF
jgi:hypothetical protein